MARTKDKQRALELRKLGKSYSEIKAILGVSKSTLSPWLKDYPLSAEKIKELRDWSPKRIENYRETRRVKREALLGQVYESEKKHILPLSKRDMAIAGLFLYWGEGGKTKPAELALSNSNPAVIIAGLRWMKECLGVNEDKMFVKLQLYRDMDVKKEVNYWSKTIQISKNRFRKPYIKKSKASSINYRRGYGHGTCNLTLANAILARKVLMGIKVVEDYFLGA